MKYVGRLALALFCVVSFLVAGLSGPAGAGKLFTIDANSNDANDLDGSDDLFFSLFGGTTTGWIRAVQLGVPVGDLDDTVAGYVDFTGGGVTAPNFATMDVLIVDVVLLTGTIDEIGIAVSTAPAGLNPIGAGYFNDCIDGAQIGCAQIDRTGVGFPVDGEIPIDGADADALAIELQAGNIFFPGAALFEFDKLGDPANGNMLDAGEVTRRLFVTWNDTGDQTPLSKVDQVAKFMISSGLNSDDGLTVDIVPEPGTAALLGLGVALLAAARRRGLR